ALPAVASAPAARRQATRASRVPNRRQRDPCATRVCSHRTRGVACPSIVAPIDGSRVRPAGPASPHRTRARWRWKELVVLDELGGGSRARRALGAIGWLLLATLGGSCVSAVKESNAAPPERRAASASYDHRGWGYLIEKLV